MNEFVVYILYLKTFNKTYVGFTNCLIDRFYSHNFFSSKGYTIKFRPWEVLHVEFYESKSQAMIAEKFLKTGVGRDKIKKIKIDYFKLR